MREVAEHLGNTMAVARSSHVDPRVVDLYMGGRTIPSGSYPSSERAVVDLLGFALTRRRGGFQRAFGWRHYSVG